MLAAAHTVDCGCTPIPDHVFDTTTSSSIDIVKAKNWHAFHGCPSFVLGEQLGEHPEQMSICFNPRASRLFSALENASLSKAVLVRLSATGGLSGDNCTTATGTEHSYTV